jgi:hypothetical protein
MQYGTVGVATQRQPELMQRGRFPLCCSTPVCRFLGNQPMEETAPTTAVVVLLRPRLLMTLPSSDLERTDAHRIGQRQWDEVMLRIEPLVAIIPGIQTLSPGVWQLDLATTPDSLALLLNELGRSGQPYDLRIFEGCACRTQSRPAIMALPT